MKKLIIALALFPVLSVHSAEHKFNGDINFTPMEEYAYKQSQNSIILGASKCFKNTINFHRAFHERYGMSPFYPDRSSFGKLHHDSKAYQLKKMGFKGMERVIAPISCVGLTLKCFGVEFKKAGLQNMWGKVRSFMDQNAQDGGALQVSLQKLGWKVYYWNPDTSKNKMFDEIEKAKNPSNSSRYWGYHAFRKHTIDKYGMYRYNPVDDATTLVNWSRRGERTPQIIKESPITIGVAHTGYHVFATVDGNVIEGHSTLPITSPRVLEGGPFERSYTGRNSYQGYPAGNFHSGLIAVPPPLRAIVVEDDNFYNNY